MTRVVSNSEANAWLECRRKYFYAYDLNLMSNEERRGKALRTGIFGHDLLKIYFELIKEKHSFEDAKTIAMQALASNMSRATVLSDLEVYRHLAGILDRYFDYFPKEHPNAEILEVETYHELPLTDNFSYGLQLDMYWRDGPFFYLTDHKFTYDFWSTTKIETKGSGQTSKYFMVLKQEGYEVDRAMINQIRYRTRQKNPYTDEEMFRESSWVPTLQELRNSMIDQIKISREIVEHRDKPIEEREREATRSLGSASCEFCDFSSICVASLRGEDVSADIESSFTQNDYGYNKVEAK